MKIIDAHNHPDWHGHNLDKFVADMDANGIAQSWLLSWECPEHEYSSGYADVIPAPALGSATGPIPFSRCLSYAERRPERFILGYAPDPRLPGACKRLRAAHSIYGVRVCGEVKCRMMYDNPDAIRMFRVAGELGLPVVLHLEYDRCERDADPWTEWWGGSIQTLEHMLRLCPGTNFLGHAPGFWIHISGDDLWRSAAYPPAGAPVAPGGEVVRLLDTYPNLYCDWSAGSGYMALARDPEFARRFLNDYSDRVLYARDFFDARHREFLDGLGLSEAALARIYHGNAERLLG